MSKAYIVTCYHSISDPQKLAAYGQLAPAAVAAFGGRILARGNAVAAYEHETQGADCDCRISEPGEGNTLDRPGMVSRVKSPPPGVWRGRPILYDDRIVSLVKTELTSRRIFSTLWKVCCNLL